MCRYKTKDRCHVRYTVCFVLLLLMVVVLFTLNICIGSVNVSFADVLNAIVGSGDSEYKAYKIIRDIRLPRAIAAMLLGGALSVSGYLLQSFFRNPIAGPFILGISSGAKLMVALLMVLLLSHGYIINSYMMIAAAFIGSMISMGFVLMISHRVNSMSILIVCGVMIGYICSAVTELIVTFADDSNIINLHGWSQGSFSNTTIDNVYIMLVPVSIMLIMAFMLSKPIHAYSLGEVYAKNLSVNIRLLKIALIIVSSILSATVTAFAGPISFVGVAVPHLIKSLLRTVKPIIIIPASFLGGAVFCLFCDLLARTVFAPTELSISTVTAVFGAPVVIYMMINRNRENR